MDNFGSYSINFPVTRIWGWIKEIFHAYMLRVGKDSCFYSAAHIGHTDSCNWSCPKCRKPGHVSPEKRCTLSDCIPNAAVLCNFIHKLLTWQHLSSSLLSCALFVSTPAFFTFEEMKVKARRHMISLKLVLCTLLIFIS